MRINKRTFLVIVFIIVGVILCGCAHSIKTPLHGGATYDVCKMGECKLNVAFEPDSILDYEGVTEAKAIFYAGKIFLIGEGFSNIWIGEIEEEEAKFSLYEIDNTKMTAPYFDWDGQILFIGWTHIDGYKAGLFVDEKGKISSETISSKERNDE